MQTIIVPSQVYYTIQLEPNARFVFKETTTVYTNFVFTAWGPGRCTNTVIDGQNNTIVFSPFPNAAGRCSLIAPYTNPNLQGLIVQNLTISSVPTVASLSNDMGWIVGCSNAQSVTLSNCFNTAPPHTSVVQSAERTSGFFGSGASNCTASNCGNSGLLSFYITSGIFAPNSSNCQAINCYNTSPIPYAGGGIFGYGARNCTASNCYNSGTMDQNGGPIFSPFNNAQCVINRCYSQQPRPLQVNGVQVINSGSGDGNWDDVIASAYLVGVPTQFPGDGANWISLSPNTRFNLLWQKTTALPCFLSGTRILTPLGQRRVETLEDYDDVLTSDGRSVRVKIHKTCISKTDSDTAPFLIPRNAFSHNVPDEDLHISGLHAVQDSNAMWQFPMGLAIQNTCNVTQHLPGRSVTYYHLECPNYYTDNIVANNVVTESFRNRQGKIGITYEYCEYRKGFVRNQEDEIKDPSEIPPNVLAVYC